MPEVVVGRDDYTHERCYGTRRWKGPPVAYYVVLPQPPVGVPHITRLPPLTTAVPPH